MSRPGALRRLGTVKRDVFSEAGGGGKTATPTDVATGVWFAATPISSSQRLQAGAEHTDVTHVLIWRALGTLKSGDWFVDDTDARAWKLKEPPRDVDDLGRYETALAVEAVS